MTKFTFKIKGHLIPQKCISILRKYLMISSKDQAPKAKKQIKAWKRPSETSVHSSSSEDEEFIPLAARDSEWVGITFYNPKFHSQAGNKENDEDHSKIVDVDTEEEPPIYTLFPALKNKLPEISSKQISTTHIAKLLVGQKPKLSYLKKSKKLSPIKVSLPSVKESPNEEKPDEKESGAEERKSENPDSKSDNLEKKPAKKSNKVPPSSN